MRLVGWPEVVNEPWFATASGRVRHVDELDRKVADWIRARPAVEVIRAVEQAEAAVAPVYDITDIFQDEHFAALDSITRVEDPDLGQVRMQNVMFRLSQTPGRINFAGKQLGADNERILVEQLGVALEDLPRLRAEGVI